MAEQINLTKEVFGRATYTKVIDTSFSELYTAVTASQQPTTITVEQFFNYYEEIFFNIAATGDINSHEYLVKRSSEYVGDVTVTDREQAYIDEINALRQQLLEANAQYLNLNEII